MKDIEALPAPELTPPPPPKDKWQRERMAFQRLLPELLPTYRDKYVAIHEEKMVDSDNNIITLAERVYDRFGYQPIYCGLVTDKPLPIVRIPSPRIPRGNSNT